MPRPSTSYCLRDSDFSLADDIGVTRKEAKAYIESYLEKYAGVRQYMHDVVEQAKADGYVTTLMAAAAICRSSKARISIFAPLESAAP